ncbi:hypothetical protein [Streptomyces sp. NPDC057702]|uniref:hypothetical protein n=1 Tax=unclassified Streptomyces TaxID=2593676 RepID=UPI0036785AE7
MVVVVAAVVVAGFLAGSRLLYGWVDGRVRVRLFQLREQGTNERLRALPAGSTLAERHRGDEVSIRVVLPRGTARG